MPSVRPFAAACIAAAMLISSRPSAASQIPIATTNLLRASVAEQAQAILDGRVTSEQLVDAALARARVTSGLNAFVTLDESGARRAARAADVKVRRHGPHPPLLGVPIVLKDNIAYAGLPTTDGTAALRHWVPSRSAPVADELVLAGAIVIGKTNMHELALGITSANATFGAVGNPWDPARFAGGSSGGTAAAVSAGVVTAGLGTDTGGSARIPAALCGIVGFRPTVGRYSADGIVPISHTRDTAGVFAHRVADVALIDGLLAHDESAVTAPALSSLRIGVPRAYFWANLDAATAALAETTLSALKARGVTFVAVDVPNVGDLDAKVGFPVALYEIMQDLPAFLAANNTGVTMQQLGAQVASPDVKPLIDGLLAGKATIPLGVYDAAMRTYRPALQQGYATYFAANHLDAMIFPTTPLPAQPIAGTTQNVMLNGKPAPTFTTFIQNTDPDSNAGIPGIHCRWEWSAHCRSASSSTAQPAPTAGCCRSRSRSRPLCRRCRRRRNAALSRSAGSSSARSARRSTSSAR